jgi:hypothetical protein
MTLLDILAWSLRRHYFYIIDIEKLFASAGALQDFRETCILFEFSQLKLILWYLPASKYG